TIGFTGGRARPQAIIRMVPMLVAKNKIGPKIQIGNGDERQLTPSGGPVNIHWPPHTTDRVPTVEGADPHEFSPCETVQLLRICYARSGDKGNNVNVGLFARNQRYLPFIKHQVTAEAVRQFFKSRWNLPSTGCIRYDVPGLGAFNYLITDILGGGGMASLHADNLGKSYGQMLLQFPLLMPSILLDGLRPTEAPELQHFSAGLMGFSGKGFDFVVHTSSHVAEIILNRPKEHNSLTDEMMASLTRCTELLTNNPDLRRGVRLVVLRATPESKTFCAGLDPREFSRSRAVSLDENVEGASNFVRVLTQLARIPQFLVCVVSGRVFGGGWGLLAACDMVIASRENTELTLSEVKLGVCPATILPLVIRRVGPSAAVRLAALATPIDADEAKAVGIVDIVVQRQTDIDSALQAVADRIRLSEPHAVSELKKLAFNMEKKEMGTAELTRSVATVIAHLRAGNEAAEGIRALKQRREPEWAKVQLQVPSILGPGVNLKNESRLYFNFGEMGNLVGVDLGGNIGKIAVRVRASDIDDCPIPTDLSFLAGDESPADGGDSLVSSSLASSEWNEGMEDWTIRITDDGSEIRFVDIDLNDTKQFLSTEVGQYLLSLQQNSKSTSFAGVGSGVWRLQDCIQKNVGARCERHRESACVLAGINYVLRHVPQECFYFPNVGNDSGVNLAGALPSNHELVEGMEFVSYERFKGIFPFLMVSMKSGTSFYRVDSPTSMYRVGGSPIGGATMMGMARHMLPASCSGTPADVLRCGKQCDFSPLDLLVSDIYGGDYPSIGLKGNTVASSFGKANNTDQRENVKSSEVARSLMNLMSMNTAQLAYLHATLYGTDNVVFVGYLLDTHLLQAFSSIQSSFNFWTGGRMKALYFRHAHYLGALGALLKRESTLATMTPGRELIPCDTVTLEQSLLDERLTNLNVSVNTARMFRKDTIQPGESYDDDDCYYGGDGEPSLLLEGPELELTENARHFDK
ncbi:hypothetical protein FOL47_011170, partial [Perkinsus chesapeaki]